MRHWILRHKADAIGIALVLFFCSALIFAQRKILPPKRQSLCQSNLKRIGLGTMLYVRDYDEQYMPARNWEDVLDPDMKSPQSFQCLARGNRASGYAYRMLFSTINMNTISESPKTIMIFDSDLPMHNASDDGASLPKPTRHPDGNNVLFMDGHVQALVNPDFKPGEAELRALFAARQKTQNSASAKLKRLRARKASGK